jgi:hypothetical protein
MSEAVLAALAAFDSVTTGDKKSYRRALAKAQRTVRDPIAQLSMVDSILAARGRAYTEVV